MGTIEKQLLKILYICTVGFVAFISIGTVGEEIRIYLSSVLIVFFMGFSFLTKCISHHPAFKINYSKLLEFIIIIFCIYVFGDALYINSNKILFAILKILPLVGFLVIYKRLCTFPKLIKELIDLCTKIFIICGFLALILYLLGYSDLMISFKHFINLVTMDTTFQLYGEPRLNWMNSHKSRFAVFCILAILFILTYKKIDKRKKVFFIGVQLINIYLANSYVFVLISLGLMAYYILTQVSIQQIKIRRFSRIILIGGCILSIIIFLNVLTTHRDVSTLGARTYIWGLTIDRINEQPFGVVQLSVEEYLRGESDLYFSFSNAHNIILNEIIESGIFGGLLYLCIWLLFFIKLRKNTNKLYSAFFLGIFIGSMFDSVIRNEISYTFWLCFALIYAKQCGDTSCLKQSS